MSSNCGVFKESSPNGKLSLYLDKREFVDYPSGTETIDGVLLVGQEYIDSGCKIWAQLVCNFRYGRVEDETMGLNFQKYIILVCEQIQPPQTSHHRLTFLQAKLLKELGGNAVPFVLPFPPAAPESVTLREKLTTGEPRGVSYYIKIFSGENDSNLIDKTSIIRFGVRKIQCTPAADNCRPSVVVRRGFLLGPGEVQLEVILDKLIYRLGETIAINVRIINRSNNKIVKKIGALIQQEIDVVVLQRGKFKVVIDAVETRNGCPINPGSTCQVVVHLRPDLVEVGKGKRVVAVTGKLEGEEHLLASSTLLSSTHDRNSFAIVVSYGIKVMLDVGGLGGKLTAELPFKLMNHKPVGGKVILQDVLE